MFSLRKIQNTLEKLDERNRKKPKLKKLEDPSFLRLGSGKGGKNYSITDCLVDEYIMKKKGTKESRFHNLINNQKSNEKNNELRSQNIKKKKKKGKMEIRLHNSINNQKSDKKDNELRSQNDKYVSIPKTDNLINLQKQVKPVKETDATGTKQTEEMKTRLNLIKQKNPAEGDQNVIDQPELFDLDKPMIEFRKHSYLDRPAIKKKRKVEKALAKRENFLKKRKVNLKSRPVKSSFSVLNNTINVHEGKISASVDEAIVTDNLETSISKSEVDSLLEDESDKNNAMSERFGIMDFDCAVTNDTVEHAENNSLRDTNEIPYFYRTTSSSYPDISYDTGNAAIYELPYLAVRNMNNQRLVVVLKPSSEIYIEGYYYLELLFGGVRILGYEFSQGESQAIFCPPCNCILPIEALEGDDLSNMDAMADRRTLGSGQPLLEWIAEVTEKEKSRSFVVVILERYHSSLTSFLMETKLLELKNHYLPTTIFNKIGISVVDQNCFDSKWSNKTLVREPLWDEYASQLKSSYIKGSRVVIVICGGKSVGKSEFLRFLVNRVLNFSQVSEINCLDLDPGQSEFSVPGTLSLLRFSTPLLGPSFINGDKMYSYRRDVFYGDISVTNALPEYLSTVSSLVDDFKMGRDKSPLIVNTMGFVQNAGLDIIVDIMRIVNPTHVVNIESTDSKSNFAFRPDQSFVNICKYGIATKNSEVKVSYNITYMPVAGGMTRRFDSAKKFIREVRLVSYLSQLWKDKQGIISGDTCQSAIVIDWDQVALHTFSSAVSQSHILQVLNGSLIALCHVTGSDLETIGPSLPKKIQKNSKWISTNRLLGYGIVRGIDTMKRKIHILTPIRVRDVINRVNLLVITKIGLPEKMFKYFTPELAPAPYLQQMKD